MQLGGGGGGDPGGPEGTRRHPRSPNQEAVSHFLGCQNKGKNKKGPLGEKKRAVHAVEWDAASGNATNGSHLNMGCLGDGFRGSGCPLACPLSGWYVFGLPSKFGGKGTFTKGGARAAARLEVWVTHVLMQFWYRGGDGGRIRGDAICQN